MESSGENLVIILMGVTGSGKSTVGEALTQDLGWPFYDGDDFHPPENVAKMKSGVALEDEDRWPWLQRLAGEIGQWLAQGDSAVLACSALKQVYRDVLVGGRPQVRVVHLKGSKELIGERLAQRQHRYMPASLLDSQFATLEQPQVAVEVDIAPEPDAIAGEIRRRLGI
ncbi:MAG: AAA family ATPase [Candidatus Latescibacteria bacterium]|nr:AAA family ATPase [Candidatus Latescibacterota bacterium]